MYQDKIAEASKLLTSHAEAINKDSAPSVVQSFMQKLRIAGGTDDESLRLCTFEDLELFGAPKLLAKRIAQVFRRGNSNEDKSLDEKAKLTKPSRVAVMTITELVQHYDPRDKTSPVTHRLGNLVKDKKCIVFDTDGSVNVDASVKLINEITDGYGERPTYSVNGVPQKVFPIGNRPGQVADENPLYPGRVLRPDGDCDQTNRSWNGISEKVRQIVYLAVSETKEIKIDSLTDAHNVLDFVMANTDDEVKICGRFFKASLRYGDLKQEGKLPSLKISRKNGGGEVEAEKKNNPFGTHKQY